MFTKGQVAGFVALWVFGIVSTLATGALIVWTVFLIMQGSLWACLTGAIAYWFINPSITHSTEYNVDM